MIQTAQCVICSADLTRVACLTEDRFRFVDNSGSSIADTFFDEHNISIHQYISGLSQLVQAYPHTPDKIVAHYSMLDASLSLFMSGHFHEHMAADSSTSSAVPESSGWPCQLRPSGWYDRISGDKIDFPR